MNLRLGNELNFLLQNAEIKIAREFAKNGQLDRLHKETSKYLETSWSRMK